MKRTILLAVCPILMWTGCGRTSPGTTVRPRFQTDVLVKTTPVANQGRSALCWAYAMLGTIESEHLMMGDSVRLSVDYMARMLLKEQAREVFFAGGKRHVSLRGTGSMALRLLDRYGMLHFDAYHGKAVNYGVLSREVERAATGAHSLRQMDHRVDELLDDAVGIMPRVVFFLHAQYTPREFANSVCSPGEYLSLTSFTHHPYGRPFVLEVPDNRYRDTFLNVHIDTLTTHIRRALRSGHPVCWEGDISEPGFSFADGVAVLPDEEAPITPAARQRHFETLRTTDDHCMVLVGMAHDTKGKTFYIAKNSWGMNNPYGGYMYLSEPYVRLKTIAVYMSRDAYRH